MQVIGGIASGISIAVPAGDSVRPTSSSAKKALFDSIANFKDTIVADIFAGSGALGLEAASRGARHVIFIESVPKNCAIISKNAEKVTKAGAEFKIELIKSDIFHLFRRPPAISSPEIVFSDPPYADSVDFMGKLFRNANFAEWARNSLLVWETPDFKVNLDGAIVDSLWTARKIRNFGGKNFVYLGIK